MSSRLRMSSELGDWLAELCTAEPASAVEVGAALVSAMTADDPAILAVVSQAAVDPRRAADDLYQRLLKALQRAQSKVVEASWSSVGANRLLAELDSEPQADPAVRAWLSRARDNAQQSEAELTKRSRRLQRDVEAFRTAKETAKAMYTAADATARIQDAIEAATGDAPVPDSDEELAAHRRAVESAEDHLQAVAAQAARTLNEVLDAAGPGTDSDDSRRPIRTEPVAGLFELRSDPLGRDVRLLFAVEPADAITLLAVVDGEDAIAAHRSQAIELAGDLLTDIRSGDWPPVDGEEPADVEVTFADSATFLARFFPTQASIIAARAAGLATARSAADLRGSMSRADLAGHTGISEQRLRQIEEDGLRAAEVSEAVAYVRGLGGRLTLTVELGESAPVQLT